MESNTNKKNTKKKNITNSTLGKKELKISPVAYIDNIVFSRNDVYAYYKIANVSYDYLPDNQKISQANGVTNAFTSIMADRVEPLAMHLVGTSTPFDVDAWANQMIEVGEEWAKNGKLTQAYLDYVNTEKLNLMEEQFLDKAVYLGIHISKRGSVDLGGLNIFESGWKVFQETFKKYLSSLISIKTSEVSFDEELASRKKEEFYYRILSSNSSMLKASRPEAEELLLILKRQFYPAMPSPYLDVVSDKRYGPGDIIMETSHLIENNARFLKISQIYGNMEYSGYRACLTLRNFPRYLRFPEGYQIPFFYLPDFLIGSSTYYSRFYLLPHKDMVKKLNKKRKQTVDLLENMDSAQRSQYDHLVNDTSGVSQDIEDSETISHVLDEDKTPWIDGSYHIVVDALTEKDLKDKISHLKTAYKDTIDVDLFWTSGDQKELFLEQMMGDKIRIKSFNQVSTLNLLSTSGFNYSSDAGDRLKELS